MTPMTAEQLKKLLHTTAIGQQAEFHSELDSTNIRAKELSLEGESRHGTVVVTERQTAGRGRMDRIWHSPQGKNLYLSLVLFPHVPPQTIPQIAILTAIALHQTLGVIFPQHHFGLKWPNDLWSVDGRKLSGILCESTCCGNRLSVVAGIGINVNGNHQDFPPELQQTAGTLQEVVGHELDRLKVLAAFLNHFEPLYEIWEQVATLEPFMEYWNDFDILKGHDIDLDVQDELMHGKVKGVLPDGRLILDQQGTISYIHAGDTHLKH